MPSSVFRYDWEGVEQGGREYSLELDVSVDWTPYRPAKVNCLPEDSCPAEGGDIEVTQVDIDAMAIGGVGRTCGFGLPDSENDYWLARFRHEVEKTDGFRDWLAEQISDEELGASEPDEDDRREER